MMTHKPAVPPGSPAPYAGSMQAGPLPTEAELDAKEDRSVGSVTVLGAAVGSKRFSGGVCSVPQETKRALKKRTGPLVSM